MYTYLFNFSNNLSVTFTYSQNWKVYILIKIKFKNILRIQLNFICIRISWDLDFKKKHISLFSVFFFFEIQFVNLLIWIKKIYRLR